MEQRKFPTFWIEFFERRKSALDRRLLIVIDCIFGDPVFWIEADTARNFGIHLIRANAGNQLVFSV
jgi:hypothetical protein